MNQHNMKQAAATAAIELIPPQSIVGVGTGSTVTYFIEALATIKPHIEGAVSSSHASTKHLQALGIPVLELNDVAELPIYVDGADEINHDLQMIKGGGGALTREKIIAAAAKEFVCIADQSKYVSKLGQFPLPIEVIPMARSYVAREIVKLGGDPVYRSGFTTDNGHLILDIHNLNITQAIELEQRINHISGVVTCGLFAQRPADHLLLATDTKVKQLKAAQKV
tara:strand:- start:11254 stop:11925 length:672 start_codon:yes stop_codon:yes gene_type:complete